MISSGMMLLSILNVFLTWLKQYWLLLGIILLSVCIFTGGLYLMGAEKTAYVITNIVSYLGKNSLKKFSIRSIHFRSLVLTVEGFELTTRARRPYSPEFQLSWDKFQLVVQWRRLFIPFYTTARMLNSSIYRRCCSHYDKWCCNVDRWCCRWEWDPLGISTALNLKDRPRTPSSRSARRKAMKIRRAGNILDNDLRIKVIQVLFEGFVMEADKMQYTDMLGTGRKKTTELAGALSLGLPKTSKRAWIFGKLGLTERLLARVKLSIRLFLTKQFVVHFTDMSFHIVMPDEAMTVYGKSSNLSMFGVFGATKHGNVDGAMVGVDILNGVMTIKQGGLHAMHFEAARSALRVDLHLPSRGQDVTIEVGYDDHTSDTSPYNEKDEFDSNLAGADDRFLSDSDSDEEDNESVTSHAGRTASVKISTPINRSAADIPSRLNEDLLESNVQHPNMAYTAEVREIAPTSMIVWMQPFLRFYNRYNDAEDEIFELMLATSAKGDVSGNMRSMKVNFFSMHVTLRHSALVLENIMLVENMSFEMLKFSLNRLGERILTYDKPSIVEQNDYYSPNVHSDIPNREKEINMGVDAIFWPQHNNEASLLYQDEPGKKHKVDVNHTQLRKAYVKGVRLNKILKVFNTDPFLDLDTQVIHVSEVFFRGLNVSLLHWLFMLQDVSNKLPNSKYSHPKEAKMNITVDSIVFGTEPDADDMCFITPSPVDAPADPSTDMRSNATSAPITSTASANDSVNSSSVGPGYSEHGFGDQDYAYGKSSWEPPSQSQDETEQYGTLLSCLEKCVTFTIKGMNVVSRKVPFALFNDFTLNMAEFSIESDMCVSQISNFHRVFCVDALDVQGARVIPHYKGEAKKEEPPVDKTADSYRKYMPSTKDAHAKAKALGEERIGAHFQFTNLEASFLLGPDIKMRHVTCGGVNVDMFSKFDGFRPSFSGKHTACTEKYARRMCFIRSEDFDVIWHPGHPAAEKPSIMHFRANLKTTTVDSSTACVIRFYCAFNALLRTTDRITRVMNAVQALDVESTSASSRARVMRRRERRLDYMQRLSMGINPYGELGVGSISSVNRYPWDITAAGNMRIEVGRLLINYCIETPNAPPTIVKTVSIYTSCKGFSKSQDVNTVSELTEDSEVEDKAELRRRRAYQRAVQQAQLHAHLATARGRTTSTVSLPAINLDGTVGTASLSKNVAYTTSLKQIARTNINEYSNHAGHLMDPQKHGTRQKVDPASIMAYAHKLERYGGQAHTTISTTPVAHTETKTLRAATQVSLRHSRRTGKNKDVSALAGSSTSEKADGIADSNGKQGTTASTTWQNIKGFSTRSLKSESEYGLGHVHNGSPYVHPLLKSRIQRQFYLESEVSRNHLLKKRQAEADAYAATPQNRDGTTRFRSNSASLFEPSRPRDSYRKPESSLSDAALEADLNTESDAMHNFKYGHTVTEREMMAFEGDFLGFASIGGTDGRVAAALASSGVIAPLDLALQVDDFAGTESAPKKWLVNLSNFQASDLLDVGTASNPQNPCVVFTWGFYEIYETAPQELPEFSEAGSPYSDNAFFHRQESRLESTAVTKDSTKSFHSAFGESDANEYDVDCEVIMHKSAKPISPVDGVSRMLWVELGRYQTVSMHKAGTQCVFPSDEHFQFILDRSPHSTEKSNFGDFNSNDSDVSSNSRSSRETGSSGGSKAKLPFRRSDFELRVMVCNRTPLGDLLHIGETRVSLSEHIPEEGRYFHFDLKLMPHKINMVWPDCSLAPKGVLGLTGFIVEMDEVAIKTLADVGSNMQRREALHHIESDSDENVDVLNADKQTESAIKKSELSGLGDSEVFLDEESDIESKASEVDSDDLLDSLMEALNQDPFERSLSTNLADRDANGEEESNEEDKDDALYLDELDHGGLYVNIEFSQFIYRSCPDLYPDNLDPHMMPSEDDPLEMGFRAQQNVHENVKIHLPTKEVEYSWKDCQLCLNNNTSKSTLRIRGFSYVTTTKNVDILSMTAAKQKYAKAQSNTDEMKSGFNAHSDANTSHATGRAAEDEGKDYATLHAADVSLAGAKRDHRVFSRDRYATPVQNVRKSKFKGKKGSILSASNAGKDGSDSDGSMYSVKTVETEDDPAHRKHHTRRYKQQPSDCSTASNAHIQKLDVIALDISSLEVGLTTNNAIGHHLDVMSRQIGLFFQALRDPKVSPGSEGTAELPVNERETGAGGATGRKRNTVKPLTREPRKLYVWTTNIKNMFAGMDADFTGYLDYFHTHSKEGASGTGLGHKGAAMKYSDGEESDNPDSTKNNRPKSRRFSFADSDTRRRRTSSIYSNYSEGSVDENTSATHDSSPRGIPPPFTPRPIGSHEETNLVRDFTSLTMIDMHVVCDASASDDAVYADILTLDLGPFLDYSPDDTKEERNDGEHILDKIKNLSTISEIPFHRDVMGGIFSFEIAQAVLGFKPMEQDPLLLVDHLAIQGPLYIAKLGNRSVNYLWEHFILSENFPLIPHRSHSRNLHAHVQHEHNVECAEHDSCSACFVEASSVDPLDVDTDKVDDLYQYLGTSIVRTDAGNKFYTELKITSNLIYVRLSNHTGEYWKHMMVGIDSLMPQEDPLVPPVPPMKWWDTTRYKFHGSGIIKIEKFIVEKLFETTARKTTHPASQSNEGPDYNKYADFRRNSSSRRSSFQSSVQTRYGENSRHGNDRIKWRFAMEKANCCADHRQIEFCSQELDFTCDYDVLVLRKDKSQHRAGGEASTADAKPCSTSPAYCDSSDSDALHYDYAYNSDSDASDAKVSVKTVSAKKLHSMRSSPLTHLEESLKTHPYSSGRSRYSQSRKKSSEQHKNAGGRRRSSGGQSSKQTRRSSSDGNPSSSHSKRSYVPVTVVARVLHIPGVLFTLHHQRAHKAYTYKDSGVLSADKESHSAKKDFIYSHHDVYLRPVVPMFDTNALVLQHSRDMNNNSMEGIAHAPYAASEVKQADNHDNSNNYFGDKFELFRSEPCSIDWDIEVVLLDSPDAPVTLNARLDMLFRILDPLMHPNDYDVTYVTGKNDAEEEAASENAQNLEADSRETNGSGEKQQATSLSSKHAVAELVTILSTTNTIHISPHPFPVHVVADVGMTDVIRNLDVKVHIKKILIVSWQSTTNCHGFVYRQERFDLDLSMKRSNDKNTAAQANYSIEKKRGDESKTDKSKADKSPSYVDAIASEAKEANLGCTTPENDIASQIPPLKIEHMIAEIGSADLYVRDWSYPRKLDRQNDANKMKKDAEPDILSPSDLSYSENPLLRAVQQSQGNQGLKESANREVPSNSAIPRGPEKAYVFNSFQDDSEKTQPSGFLGGIATFGANLGSGITSVLSSTGIPQGASKISSGIGTVLISTGSVIADATVDMAGRIANLEKVVRSHISGTARTAESKSKVAVAKENGKMLYEDEEDGCNSDDVWSSFKTTSSGITAATNDSMSSTHARKSSERVYFRGRYSKKTVAKQFSSPVLHGFFIALDRRLLVNKKRVEPSTLKELQSLFVPINLIAHTSELKISLTESDNIGNLQKNRGIPEDVRGMGKKRHVFDRLNIRQFKVGGDNPIMVCPQEGTMGGLFVAAKRTDKTRTVATVFGGKPTKRRWFELTNDLELIWCASRDRRLDMLKGSISAKDIIGIRPKSSNPYVLEACRHYSLEVQTTKRVFEFGCDSIFEYENWLLALRVAYRQTHHADIFVVPLTRISLKSKQEVSTDANSAETDIEVKAIEMKVFEEALEPSKIFVKSTSKPLSVMIDTALSKEFAGGKVDFKNSRFDAFGNPMSDNKALKTPYKHGSIFARAAHKVIKRAKSGIKGIKDQKEDIFSTAKPHNDRGFSFLSDNGYDDEQSRLSVDNNYSFRSTRENTNYRSQSLSSKELDDGDQWCEAARRSTAGFSSSDSDDDYDYLEAHSEDSDDEECLNETYGPVTTSNMKDILGDLTSNVATPRGSYRNSYNGVGAAPRRSSSITSISSVLSYHTTHSEDEIKNRERTFSNSSQEDMAMIQGPMAISLLSETRKVNKKHIPQQAHELSIGSTMVSSLSFRKDHSGSFTMAPHHALSGSSTEGVDSTGESFKSSRVSDTILSPKSLFSSEIKTFGQARRFSSSVANLLLEAVVTIKQVPSSAIIAPTSGTASFAYVAIPLVVQAAPGMHLQSEDAELCPCYMPVKSEHFGNIFHARSRSTLRGALQRRTSTSVPGRKDSDSTLRKSDNGAMLDDETQTEDAYGNKIWGLRVVDIRLLWTIDIRDVLYSYVNRIFELKDQAEIRNEEKIKAEASMAAQQTSVYVVTESNIPTGRTRKSSVTVASSDNNSVVNSPNKYDRSRSQRHNYMNNVSYLGTPYRGRLGPQGFGGRGLAGGSIVSKGIRTGGAYRDSTGDNNMSLNQFFHLKPQALDDLSRSETILPLARPDEPDKRGKVKLSIDTSAVAAVPPPPALSPTSPMSPGGTRKKNVSFTVSVADATTTSKSTTAVSDDFTIRSQNVSFRSPRSPESLSDHALEQSELINLLLTAQNDRENTKMRAFDPNKPPRKWKQHVFSASKSASKEQRTSKNRERGPKTPSKSSSVPSGSNQRSKSANQLAAEERASARRLPKRFFFVELVNPQLNFLDTKNHGSLIAVAGRSTLEGFRSGVTVQPAGTISPYTIGSRIGGMSPESLSHMPTAKPKRKIDLAFRMDGVSAFTVSTKQNGGVELASSDAGGSSEAPQSTRNLNSKKQPSNTTLQNNSVYWKLMENTHVEVSKCMGVRIDKDTATLADEGNGAKGTGPDNSKRDRNEAGVCLQAGGSERATNSLKKAITDFDIKTSYSFFVDMTREDMIHVIGDPVFSQPGEMRSDFNLDLQKFEMDIESQQFFIISDVTRNVLLEPPPKLRKSERSTNEERLLHPPSDTPHNTTGTSDTTDWNSNTQGIDSSNANKTKDVVRIPYNQNILNDKNIKLTAAEFRSLKELTYTAKAAVRILVEHSLGQPLERDEGTERDVRCTIGEGTWILRTDNDAETVTTSFTGVEASFNYKDNRQLKTLFTVQRFSVKRNDLQQGTENWVIEPVVEDVEPCVRCRRVFRLEENHSEACGIHTGEYCETITRVVNDSDTKSADAFESVPVMMWSCCSGLTKDAIPCSFKHHQFKEKMLQVNALTNPKTSVENVDVTILELDISVFPGSNYDLKMHISDNLSTVFSTYFGLGKHGEDGHSDPNAVAVDVPVPGAALNKDEVDSRDVWGPTSIKARNYSIKSIHSTDAQQSMGAVARHQILETDLQYATPHVEALLMGTASTAHAGRYDSQGYPIINTRGAVDAKTVPTPISTPKKKGSIRESFKGYFARSPAPYKVVDDNNNDTDSVIVPTLANTPLSLSFPTPQLRSGLTISTDFANKDGEEGGSDKFAASAPESKGKSLDTIVSSVSELSTGNVVDSAVAMDEAGSYAATGTAFTDSTSAKDSPISVPEANSGSIVAVDANGVAKRHELLFLRRLRMGGLKATVNTFGFRFNVTNLAAEIDSLTIHGQALSWSQLFANLISHTRMSILRHAKVSTIVSSLFSWSSVDPRTDMMLQPSARASALPDDKSKPYANIQSGVDNKEKDCEKKPKLKFFNVPIPFSSWAADEASKVAPSLKVAVSQEMSSNDRAAEAATTANAAHRADLAKLLGKWQKE